MDLDLRSYLNTLNKRKWWLVGVLVIVLGLGTLVTVRATPEYEAETTLFVGERQFVVEEIFEGIYGRIAAVGLLKSYTQIITSRTTAQLAISEAGLDLSPVEVQRRLSAASPLETQIILLTYRSPDPVEAQRVANAVASAFVDEVGNLDSAQVDGQPLIRVSIVDRAVVPGSPVSPNLTRNLLLALLVGLAAGIGAVFVVDQLDVTVKGRSDLEALGLPLLGSIPRMKTKGEDVHIESDQHGLGGEAFRKLRTSIGFLNLESPVRTLLVTSSMPQEGKTTVAINLAVAYALGGLRTLLVEADLRRPSLHRHYGMIGTRGLTTAIVGEVPLSEAILPTETRNLSVMLAGAIPPNPVELLGSEQMAELLDRLERMFDVVIVDSPPAMPVADPAALAARCGGVVVVARAGKTDRRRLAETSHVVEKAGGRLLGVALNFLKPSEAPYEYEYYYYGYRGEAVPKGSGAGDERAVAGREQA